MHFQCGSRKLNIVCVSLAERLVLYRPNLVSLQLSFGRTSTLSNVTDNGVWNDLQLDCLVSVHTLRSTRSV
jgi:hypothetical protein